MDTIDKAMLSMTLSKDPALKNTEKESIDAARGQYRAAVKKIEEVLAGVKDAETKSRCRNSLEASKPSLQKEKPTMRN